ARERGRVVPPGMRGTAFADAAKARVAHAERLVDVPARELVEGLTGSAADDLAERDEVDVAVDEARARGAAERLAVEALQHLFVARPLLAQIEVRRKPRTVSEQLLDGDLLPPLALQLRDVVRGGVAQAEL